MATHSGLILVVENDRPSCLLLAEDLERLGFRVKLAVDGRQALAMLCLEPFDLVLLDLVLPDVDGHQVLAQIKADSNLRQVPVIVISGVGGAEDAACCIDLGAADYLAKPLHTDLLRARMSAVLAAKHLHDLARTHMLELERHNQELDAFAHTVAHDLRNPLALIGGYASLLEVQWDYLSADERQMALAAIVSGVDKLNNIIEALLVLSGVRLMRVELRPLNMAQIVNEALGRLPDLVRAVQLEMTQPEEWPVALGYEPWVEEIWVNYLSNGLKYGGLPGANGGMIVNLELGGALQADGAARFWVRDHGAGITHDAQACLFTPSCGLSTVRANGYGLGLSVVLRIVEKLGGHAGVESRGIPGEGSLFFFTLPAAPPVPLDSLDQVAERRP